MAERAHRVGRDYRAHARRIDEREFGRDSTRVLHALDRMGQVRGLVVGFYAEASPDVYHLVDAAADRASRRWGVWGARSQAEMRAYLIARYRRDLGVAFARARAEHLLRRREFVGMSRETLAALMREQRLAPGAVREEGPGGAGAVHGLWREQARPVRAGDA